MRFFLGLVLALALGVMGCGETSGAGGSAGDGGSAGVGGGGIGGDSGEPVPGLWTGQGDCWAICFTVNEAGDALTQGDASGIPGLDCQYWAIDVAFEGCGYLGWGGASDIPIVDGSFEVDSEIIVKGRFESATKASGTFENKVDECSGAWVAAPGIAPPVRCEGEDDSEPCTSFCANDVACYPLEEQIPWCLKWCGDLLDWGAGVSAECGARLTEQIACVGGLQTCELVDEFWAGYWFGDPSSYYPCKTAVDAADSACM